MSLASSSSYSVAGSAIKQQGILTIGTATYKCVVPCPSITATDVVLLNMRTQTARTNPDVGLDGAFTTTITPGTGFEVVSLDVAYTGTVQYAVFANSLPDVNIAGVAP